MAHQLNHLAAARAHHRLAKLHAAELRNGGAQAEGRAVRINVHACRRAGNGLHRLGGRPQRVLIGRQFHNIMGIQAQFPGRLLNGLARLVSHQFQHMLVCETLNTHSGGMLPPFPTSGNTDFHPERTLKTCLSFSLIHAAGSGGISFTPGKAFLSNRLNPLPAAKINVSMARTAGSRLFNAAAGEYCPEG